MVLNLQRVQQQHNDCVSVVNRDNTKMQCCIPVRRVKDALLRVALEQEKQPIARHQPIVHVLKMCVLVPMVLLLQE